MGKRWFVVLAEMLMGGKDRDGAQERVSVKQGECKKVGREHKHL